MTEPGLADDLDASAESPRPETRARGLIAGRLSPAIVVFAGNLVARGLGFLFPVVLANLLDRPEFAVAMFLINTGFFAGELVLTGFPTAMTRALAAERDPKLHPGWILAAGIGGVPFLAISVLLGAVLALRADAPVGLLMLVIVGLTIDAYYFALLRGLRRFGWLAIYRVAANLAQLLVILALALAGEHHLSLGVVVVVYSFIYLLPIIVIELVDGPLRHALAPAAGAALARATEWAHVIDLTKFAIPALLSGTAYGAILGFDVFFVRIFAPDSLADYAAARSLALPMMLVPFALAVVLLPQAAAAPAAIVGALLRRALIIAGVAALLGWLGYVVLGPTVIDLFFPPSYEAAAGPLTTLVPAVGLLGIYSIMSGWMMGINRPWTAALCLSAGAIVTIIGHMTITAQYGAIGAGVAMTLGAGTALVLVGVATWRILRSGLGGATGPGAGAGDDGLPDAVSGGA